MGHTLRWREGAWDRLDVRCGALHLGCALSDCASRGAVKFSLGTVNRRAARQVRMGPDAAHIFYANVEGSSLPNWWWVDLSYLTIA